MTNRTKILAVAAFATAVAVAGVASVARALAVNEKRAQLPLGLISKVTQLGITDAQTKKIRGILREQKVILEPLVKQCVTERRALRDTIRSSPVNENAIRAQTAKVAKVEADLAVQRARVYQEVEFTGCKSKRSADCGELWVYDGKGNGVRSRFPQWKDVLHNILGGGRERELIGILILKRG